MTKLNTTSEYRDDAGIIHYSTEYMTGDKEQGYPSFAELTPGAQTIVEGVFDRQNTDGSLRAWIQDGLLDGERKKTTSFRAYIVEAGEALRTLNDNNRAYQVLVSTVSQATTPAAGWPKDLSPLSLQRDKKTQKCKVAIKVTRESVPNGNKMTATMKKDAERLASVVASGKSDPTLVIAKFLAMCGLTSDDVINIADIMEHGEEE